MNRSILNEEVRDVYPAEPYRPGEMHSRGKASFMLVRQCNFPNQYVAGKDVLLSKDHDRLIRLNEKATQEVFVRHTDKVDYHLESWLETATDEKVFEFLQDILKADQGVRWTGYRIAGTVGGNGWFIWALQLFAKHPETRTEVYTGPNAPNILLGPRN